MIENETAEASNKEREAVNWGPDLAAGAALTTPGVEYAGFWRRFLASLIDAIILGVVVGVINLGFGDLGELVGLIVGWIYYACLESSDWQATLGKKAIGIIVTDLDGNRLSFGRATGRHFAKILSAIILLIGYIMAGFTQRKQALHDIIAGCLVVMKK